MEFEMPFADPRRKIDRADEESKDSRERMGDKEVRGRRSPANGTRRYIG